MSTGNEETPSKEATSRDAPAEPLPEETPSRAEPLPAEPSGTSPTQTDQIIAKAVRHIKAKRGGDLAAIILAGSAARDALTAHSDVDFMVLVKGMESSHELVRILDRIVEIRYQGVAQFEEQVQTSPRLPVILRKARVLFEFDRAGSQLLEQARARFRQGPPSLTIHEKIRTRIESLHWLGKAEDHQAQPALARHLFSIYLDECMNAFYRLRGFWPASPTECLRFISQRDRTLGDLFQEALTAADLAAQLDAGRRIADYLFKEVPSPARID